MAFVCFLFSYSMGCQLMSITPWFPTHRTPWHLRFLTRPGSRHRQACIATSRIHSEADNPDHRSVGKFGLAGNPVLVRLVLCLLVLFLGQVRGLFSSFALHTPETSMAFLCPFPVRPPKLQHQHTGPAAVGSARSEPEGAPYDLNPSRCRSHGAPSSYRHTCLG